MDSEALNQLARRSVESDSALRQLREHSERLMAAAVRMSYRNSLAILPHFELDDLLESAFVDALLAYQRSGWKGYFSTYLVNTIRWRLLDYQRSPRFRQVMQTLPLEQVESCAHGHDNHLQLDIDDIRRRLLRHGEVYVQLFDLAFVQGYTLDECCRQLGIGWRHRCQILSCIRHYVQQQMEGSCEDVTQPASGGVGRAQATDAGRHPSHRAKRGATVGASTRGGSGRPGCDRGATA